MRYLTVEDVASVLKVKPKTAWKYVKSGKIPAFQIGGRWRVSETDLDAWISQQKQATGFPQLLLTTDGVAPPTGQQVAEHPLPFNGDSLRFVDLFAGCGGLSLGLHWAGLRGVFAAEYDQMAFDSLNFNLIEKKNVFPDWPIELPKKPLDVVKLATETEEIQMMANLHEQVDLLAGGPPCQGFRLQVLETVWMKETAFLNPSYRSLGS